MKLVMVLMLTALPLYCYAGHGCDVLAHVVDKTIDSNVSTTDYVDEIQKLTSDRQAERGFRLIKECFLSQSEETLEKVQEMQQAIYNSIWCARY